MKLRISRNQSETAWWVCFLISIMIVVNMVPYFSRNASLTLQFAVLVLVPSSIIYTYRKLDAFEKKTIYLLLLYIGIEALYKIIGISSASVDYYFTTIKFFWTYLIFRPLHSRLSKEQKEYLVLITIACYLYTVATNINYSNTYHHYISMYARETDSNAANTAYATSVMLLSGLFIVVCFSAKHILVRIASIALAVIGFYYLVFVAERGTTFVLSIFMLFLLFLNRRDKKSMRGIILFILGIVGLFAYFTGSITSLLLWIQSLLPDRLAIRMTALINLINGSTLSGAGSTISSRYALIQNSIQTFFGSFKAFFFGVGDIRTNNMIVGNHSQWIDVFARYGILWGSLLIGIVFRISKIICNDYSQYSMVRREYKVIFSMFLIRGLVGNVFAPAIGTVLLISIPCAMSLLEDKVPY